MDQLVSQSVSFSRVARAGRLRAKVRTRHCCKFGTIVSQSVHSVAVTAMQLIKGEIDANRTFTSHVRMLVLVYRQSVFVSICV